MTDPQNAPKNTSGNGVGFWLAPSITIGFGSAIAMWVVWFATHLPWAEIPGGAVMPAAVVTMLAAMVFGGMRSPAGKGWLIGGVSGLVCGVVNLMLLGNRVVEQPASTAEMGEAANQLRPDAALIVGGFLVFSIVVGIVGVMVGRTLARGPAPAPDRWLGRFGIITAVAMVPLIVVGGLVTSTESGMAVPDPVTSYGAVSFLFPLSLMADESRIFFEHSHRLFGTLVGLTSIVLMLFSWMVSDRRAPKIMSTILLVAVVVQGVLGIVRVGENSTLGAVAHGVAAQLVMAFAVWTAAVVSPAWGGASDASPRTVEAGRASKALALAALHLLFVQLIMGAMTRHMGSSHAMWTHIGLAIFVVGLCHMMGASLRRAEPTERLGRFVRAVGMGIMIVVTIQFLLGGLVFMAIGMDPAPPTNPTAEELATAEDIPIRLAIIRTVHQANGAFLLALVILGTAWSGRLKRVWKQRGRPEFDAAAQAGN